MTRLYRTALRLLPVAVRERHGREMERVFASLLRDARVHRGWPGMLHSAVRELAALLWFAWCEHRGAPSPPRIDERLMAWPTDRAAVGSSPGLAQLVSSIGQDVRYAIRGAIRTPGFTLVCLCTMALAIGANTAIFSVVNAVLLHPLPFEKPERIVVLGHLEKGAEELSTTSPGNFYDWQAQSTAFEHMAAFDYTDRTVTWDGNAERVLGVTSVGSIFEVLGRQAAHGRTFVASEDRPGSDGVVVLSLRLARRIFGRDDPIGQALNIGGKTHTVLGVMPADFAFPDWDAQYWVPAGFDAAFRDNRDQYFLEALGRLRPGVSIEQARAQIDTIMDGIRRRFPQHTENARAGVVGMKDLLVKDVRLRLLMLMGAVLFILLISCANLGNLLLARAATRREEMALRQALGARPLRLARQMVTESVLLAVGGGVIGLGTGAVLLRALVSWLPDDLPRAGGIGMDPDVLAFTAVVSVLSGLAFGLFPAWHAAGGAGVAALGERSRGSVRAPWVRSTFVATEVALALVLLLGAGLLVRSFARLSDVKPGFRSDRLLTMSVGLPTNVYREAAARQAFFENALERLRRMPGVTGVAMASTLPVSGRGVGAWFNILDRPLQPTQTPPAVPYRVVDPGYLRQLGIPLLRGRDFTSGDRLDGTRAVIVSESVARRFWPREDPLGKKIYLGAPDNRLFPEGEIVGIAADVKQTGLDEDRPEAAYVPFAVMPYWSQFSFAIRTSGDPAGLALAARRQIRAIDPSIPASDVRTMQEIVARSVAPARSSMLLVGLFAGVALLEALVGVFGVLSYTVSQRTKELGIRMALGARARDVVWLVLVGGMRPVLAGIGIGLAGGLAVTRYLHSLLFGVTPSDPATFIAAALMLGAVAALASYWVARRATRVDPIGALKTQ
jgi:putative ABC transport system permease protein